MEIPLEFPITDPKTGHTAAVRCTALLRRLTGMRCTYDGFWKGQPVIVKIFTSPLRGFLHLKREMRGLRRLAERGIPSPALLHSGKDPSGRWALILEKITPADDLANLLEKTEDPQQKAELCLKWLDFVALMHQKGVLQKDLHPGNFLFNGSRLYALDPGTIHFRRNPVSIEQGLEQLAGMLCTMPPALRENPQPLLEHYGRLRGLKPTADTLARLETYIFRQQRRLLRQTLPKTLRNSKRYFSLQEGPYRGMFTRQDWTEETARQFIRQIDLLMEAGQILKRGNTCFVSRVQFGSLDIAVKRYNYKGFWHSLRHTLKDSRARKCWLAAHRLMHCGIPTPRPLAFIIQRRFGLLRQSYLLSEFLPGSNLDEFLKSSAACEEKEKIVRRVKTILSSLAANGMVHHDLKPSNIRLTNAQPVLIDLDALRSQLFLRRKDSIQKEMEAAFCKRLEPFIHAAHSKQCGKIVPQ
ncbi:MAG TPA: lipopolysaccharide kinase InaA family protein [Anaerohalosphaeraceae bacterium]|nr:lipopolysaccharide kinase InaA family protein [Anaerohalosphaeraceae bacterium]HOL89097.1 lipopolysaccharide kinase InaA family protein [Anaerohalosphaeraceae bacterium]HPP56637.1 lipopolysaccharide kinase InaA family protein [Anaerohalosphaeraceae bacterium]